MITLVDISDTILYKLEKAHNQVLEMINACVSHEMRNPLNSIIAQNIEKDFLYDELEQTLKYYKSSLRSISSQQCQFFKKCSQLTSKLRSGLKIQRSSGNILTFIVQDLLDYAQIRSGKFRKNLSEFSIFEAVNEVMLI